MATVPSWPHPAPLAYSRSHSSAFVLSSPVEAGAGPSGAGASLPLGRGEGPSLHGGWRSSVCEAPGVHSTWSMWLGHRSQHEVSTVIQMVGTFTQVPHSDVLAFEEKTHAFVRNKPVIGTSSAPQPHQVRLQAPGSLFLAHAQVGPPGCLSGHVLHGPRPPQRARRDEAVASTGGGRAAG